MKNKTSCKLIALVLVTVVAVQVACNFSNQSSNPPSQDEGITTLAPAPTQALPEDAIVAKQAAPTLSAASQVQETATAALELAQALSGDATTTVTKAIQQLPNLSYRKLEWFTDSQGNPPHIDQPPDLVAEFTPPNNSHITFRDVEYILLSGNFYTRNIGGDWQLSVPDAASQDTAVKVAEMFTQAILSGAITIQVAGSETVHGIAAHIFLVDGQVDVSGKLVPISGKVWIGNDGRLVKMELMQPDNQQVFDISLYEYDPGITIQAPIP